MNDFSFWVLIVLIFLELLLLLFRLYGILPVNDIVVICIIPISMILVGSYRDNKSKKKNTHK